VAGAGLEAVVVVEGAGLAVEGLEAEASAAVWDPDSLGADRASVPEAFGTSVGVAISAAVAGSVIVIGSSSSATSAFTIRSSTDTIPTDTDIILTATDTVDTATGDTVTATATMDTGTDTVLTISPVIEDMPR